MYKLGERGRHHTASRIHVAIIIIQPDFSRGSISDATTRRSAFCNPVVKGLKCPGRIAHAHAERCARLLDAPTFDARARFIYLNLVLC